MRNLLVSLLIAFILGFSFQPLSLSAQEPSQLPKAPETVEEAESLAKRILEALPNAVKRVWQNDALPLWQKTWVKWWYSSIKPWLQNTWDKAQILLGKEVKKRQPAIKKEFKKEKKEMKEEIEQEMPGLEKTLWERFQEIIK